MNSKDGFDKVAVVCVAGYLSAGGYEWALGWLDAMKRPDQCQRNATSG